MNSFIISHNSVNIENITLKGFQQLVSPAVFKSIAYSVGAYILASCTVYGSEVNNIESINNIDFGVWDVSRSYRSYSCEDVEIGIEIEIAVDTSQITEPNNSSSGLVQVLVNDSRESINYNSTERSTIQRIWVSGDVVQGKSSLLIQIDPDNEISESNELNNTFEIALEELINEGVLYPNPDCNQPKLGDNGFNKEP